MSRTIPHRGSSRDPARVAVLLVAGTGAVRAPADTPGQSRVIPVASGLDIGRRPPPAADGRGTLVLADRSVSSLHARIIQTSGGSPDRPDTFEIRDLGSTNGTSVDGRPLTAPTPLRSGSLIFVGGQVLVFRLATPAELDAIAEDAAHPFAPVPTLSPVLAAVCSRLRRLAPSAGEIFLLGETGVGKEVFARAIHERSGRTGQLVAINCAAIPRELVESELFGYEKGAHSTAQGRKGGFIEAAQGGTLFLDELAEMPPELQSKLLRFIQDRKFSALGSTRVQEADVRIIAASSRTAMTVKSGTGSIQAALLGRLGAQPIQLPALRERIEDLGRLAGFFLRGADRSFDTEAFHALCLHHWPHNVRELQKVVAEAEILGAGSPSITFEHLPESITALVEQAGDPDSRRDEAPTQQAASHAGGAPGLGEGAVRDPLDPAVKTARTRRVAPSAAELIQLLAQHQGNVAHVARHLKRQYAVVWRIIQRYGIAADDFRPGGGGAPGAAGAGAVAAVADPPSDVALDLDEDENEDEPDA
ncbi:MAG TPA: sigma 54-interacting transcriptional regulator [Polyangia bacterium]|nr:sigma 54-interacting transcriptional regulator [Polyangia bacterium]